MALKELQGFADRHRALKPIAIITAALTLATTSGAAPLKKADLLALVSAHVDVAVIRAVVQRDCVDFELTPQVIIELTPQLPAGVIEDAIRCTANLETPLSTKIAADVRGWRLLFPAVDRFMYSPFGTPRSEVMKQLQANGFQVGGEHPSFNCTSKERDVENCSIDITDPAWKFVRPNVATTDEFIQLEFRSGVLTSALIMMQFSDRDTAELQFGEVRSAFHDAWKAEPEEAGWFKRKFASALIPGGSIAHAVAWRSDRTMAAASLLYDSRHWYVLVGALPRR